MREEAATITAPPLCARHALGLWTPANWLQLVRSGLVGAGGYAVERPWSFRR